MTLIKKGCMIYFHGKHITPAYMEEDKQKMLIDEGLIADKYLVKAEKVEAEKIAVAPLSDATQTSISVALEVEEKTAIREELKSMGIKAGGRASLDKLREMLKEAKGE